MSHIPYILTSLKVRAMSALGLNSSSYHHLVPPHVRGLLGTTQRGPNCWNATALYFGWEKEVKWTNAKDLLKFIDKHTVEVEKCDDPDTIMLFFQRGQLIHSAIFIAPNMLFHKYGCAFDWNVIHVHDMKRIYYEATSFKYYKVISG